MKIQMMAKVYRMKLMEFLIKIKLVALILSFLLFLSITTVKNRLITKDIRDTMSNVPPINMMYSIVFSFIRARFIQDVI